VGSTKSWTCPRCNLELLLAWTTRTLMPGAELLRELTVMVLPLPRLLSGLAMMLPLLLLLMLLLVMLLLLLILLLLLLVGVMLPALPMLGLGEMAEGGAESNTPILSSQPTSSSSSSILSCFTSTEQLSAWDPLLSHEMPEQLDETEEVVEIVSRCCSLIFSSSSRRAGVENMSQALSRLLCIFFCSLGSSRR